MLSVTVEDSDPIESIALAVGNTFGEVDHPLYVEPGDSLVFSTQVLVLDAFVQLLDLLKGIPQEDVIDPVEESHALQVIRDYPELFLMSAITAIFAGPNPLVVDGVISLAGVNSTGLPALEEAKSWIASTLAVLATSASNPAVDRPWVVIDSYAWANIISEYVELQEDDPEISVHVLWTLIFNVLFAWNLNGLVVGR